MKLTGNRGKKRLNGHHQTAVLLVFLGALSFVPPAFLGPRIDVGYLGLYALAVGLAVVFWRLGNRKAKREANK